jgi:aryl-alcohol dehydrogenase-like predicted oxidoreductase
MKSLAISEKYGLPRYVSHQAYYSLIAREYEWELMPLALDQGIGTIVWSPLSGGLLTGKVRRNVPAPENSRAASPSAGVPFDEERLLRVVDVLDEVARETGKSIPQVAVNWVLHRPSVASVILGARHEQQLRNTLGATGWKLSASDVRKLDAASETTPVYPYWHQRATFSERNPSPTELK